MGGFATTTPVTILNETLTEAGAILTEVLPTLFIFVLSVAATFMVWRWVLRIIRKPR